MTVLLLTVDDDTLLRYRPGTNHALARLQNLSGSRYNPNTIAIERVLSVRSRIAGGWYAILAARSMYGYLPGM
jgi:hypothetical protein